VEGEERGKGGGVRLRICAGVGGSEGYWKRRGRERERERQTEAETRYTHTQREREKEKHTLFPSHCSSRVHDTLSLVTVLFTR
jgi:hypothetical protein